MSDPGRVFIELLGVTARLGVIRSVPLDVLTLVRTAWARCRVDQRLHLLTARAVLDLAILGCALACCGALILTPELVLRGAGTACGGCLAAGSA